jgi:hypothetical protein
MKTNCAMKVVHVLHYSVIADPTTTISQVTRARFDQTHATNFQVTQADSNKALFILRCLWRPSNTARPCLTEHMQRIPSLLKRTAIRLFTFWAACEDYKTLLCRYTAVERKFKIYQIHSVHALWKFAPCIPNGLWATNKTAFKKHIILSKCFAMLACWAKFYNNAHNTVSITVTISTL